MDPLLTCSRNSAGTACCRCWAQDKKHLPTNTRLGRSATAAAAAAADGAVELPAACSAVGSERAPTGCCLAAELLVLLLLSHPSNSCASLQSSKAMPAEIATSIRLPYTTATGFSLTLRLLLAPSALNLIRLLNRLCSCCCSGLPGPAATARDSSGPLVCCTAAAAQDCHTQQQQLRTAPPYLSFAVNSSMDINHCRYSL